MIERLNEFKVEFVAQHGEQIPLPKLDEIKKALYQDVADPKWLNSLMDNPSIVQATMSIARAARKRIEQAVPEVASLNAQYGLLSSMRMFLAGEVAGAEKSLMRSFVEPTFERIGTAVAVAGKNTFGKIPKPLFGPAVQAAKEPFLKRE